MNEHRTWIELDASALFHNIAQVRALIGGQCALGAVLKSNAYGHGAEQIAQLLRLSPEVAWVCTAGMSEAQALGTDGPQRCVLAYLDGDLTYAVEQQLHCGVSDMQEIALLDSYARRLNQRAVIHIKIDTNMHRRGFLLVHLDQVLDRVAFRHPLLHIAGIYSHMGDTNNPDTSGTQAALRTFFSCAQYVEQRLGRPLMKHALASGSLWSPQRGDMVRVGTLLYGIWKSALHRQRLERALPGMTVRPVLTWKSRIIQIKAVPLGAYVGYDRGFCARRPTTIAVVPVGYADGYQRRLSNCGIVQIRGQSAPVIGIISMNLMTVDITDIQELSVGDEVTLLGGSGYASVAVHAALLNTNPLELLVALHPHIPRVVIGLNTHEEILK